MYEYACHFEPLFRHRASDRDRSHQQLGGLRGRFLCEGRLMGVGEGEGEEGQLAIVTYIH